MHSCCRINLAMNRGVEFTSDSSGPDWTVTIDEMQSSPHRCAPGAHNLPDRLRFVLQSVCMLRPWIDAEVKALRIKRRGFKQLLGEVVFGNAAVQRDAEICGKEREKCDRRNNPFANLGIAEKNIREIPKRSQAEKNPGQRKSVLAARVE